jgi:hypothetical protein
MPVDREADPPREDAGSSGTRSDSGWPPPGKKVAGGFSDLTHSPSFLIAVPSEQYLAVASADSSSEAEARSRADRLITGWRCAAAHQLC